MIWAAQGGGISLSLQDGAAIPGLQGVEVIRVGESADALPASILPTQGRAVPALAQKSPPDVVSGWVRIWIAGFLAERPNWDGVICALHGDVSHWLHLSANEVVSCQSFLTLRLQAALGGDHVMNGNALTETMSRPERLASHLRIAEVSGDKAAITGHLLGAEIAAAKPYWLGQQVAVIGDYEQATLYVQALETQSCPVESRSVEDVVPGGLAALETALGLAE